MNEEKLFTHLIPVARLLAIIFVSIFFFYFVCGNLNALTIVKREELALDDSVIREDRNFGLPSQILIAPIFSPSNSLDSTEESWVRGIYHYTTTKLGFSDVPLHYVVTGSGKIFEANRGGDERIVSVRDVGESTIVIGYLVEAEETSVNPRALQPLKELLKEVCNRNSIAPDKIRVSGIKFVKDPQKSTVFLASRELFGLWNSNFNEVINYAQSSYSPVAKQYNIQITQIVVPTEEIEPNQEFNATVTLKNNSQYGIYGGTNSGPVLTSHASGTSAFFLNNEWLTTTQVELLKDGQILLPGEENSFEIKLRTPLFVGAYAENFDLYLLDGRKMNNPATEIKVNIKKTERQIIEIDTKGLESVNIRSGPGQGYEIIRQGVPGERFFLITENFETGWFEIDLGDGRNGWIAFWYIRYL